MRLIIYKENLYKLDSASLFMAKDGDYTFSVKPFYQGGYSSIDPKKNPFYTGAKLPAGEIGMGTDARTANIAQEISSKLSTGAKLIELNQVFPEVFEAVPEEQLKEVKREAKLTNADITFHAPIVGRDASGLTQQGRFEESKRKEVERQMLNAIQRGSQISDDKPVTITFHAAEGIPGADIEIDPKKGEIIRKLPVVNRDQKSLTVLEEERLHYPIQRASLKPADEKKLIDLEEKFNAHIIDEDIYRKKAKEILSKLPKTTLEKGEIWSPERRLESLNATEWDNAISQLIFNKERADEILLKNKIKIAHLEPGLVNGTLDIEKDLSEGDLNTYNSYKNAKAYLDDISQSLHSQFSRAYKYSNEEDKKRLSKFAKTYEKEINNNPSIFNKTKALNNFMLNLKKITPEVYVSAGEYALEKSSDTFSNVALNAYKSFKSDKKFKDKKMPVIAIENSYAGGAFSRGEDLRKVIEESRKKFIEKLKEKEGLSEKNAKKIAEQTIGATWDTGRINLLRKQGFTEKDIINETKAIAPYVKHTHLSDNFGFEGSESAPGTGNVPFKEMLKTLKKGGAEGKQIVEALNWFQHFKTPPTTETFEALGSSIYETEGSPYWYQANALQQGYLGGMQGNWIPDMNYQTFGAGFIPLSMELGAGMKQGAGGGRVSGRPME